ncbi:SDR family NAD(P)-dependent oxidoreductase [Psychrobacter urativorans]|uniref:Short-chain dehydrogenase n=1 Tax=Psychrobacter urativorans TaxID=45610 RepID=A0A0M4U5I4_9GAMM|nr:SDR family NAD(P)-dependent oxidoreductase [Psychrobacter urativorans]ALF60206.1 hypothetical protein AOC03_09290 [Psychrobacter urativorans]
MNIKLPCQYVNNKSHKPCVIIIGGTSGIGLALALEHIKLGWDVIVVGSSLEKIQALNKYYPMLTTIQNDVSKPDNRQKLFQQLNEQFNAQPFERLIYCAGWYLNERVTTLNQVDSAHSLAVNLQAFNDIFAWASENLKQQDYDNEYKSQRYSDQYPSQKPALICLSSIAGLLDYPYTSLYAKCKRAMIATASAYRLALAPFNIQVTCIASGYVNTQALRDLNDGDTSHKPFIMSEQTAVKHIMHAINHDVVLAIFPKRMRYLIHILNSLPSPLLNIIMRQKLDK